MESADFVMAEGSWEFIGWLNVIWSIPILLIFVIAPSTDRYPFVLFATIWISNS